MRLFTFWRSSAAYRVRIALNLKGLSFESVSKKFRLLEHRHPDYLRINPQGLIPVLEDRNLVLSQSLAIIEYLEETHPTPPLLPRGAQARAEVRSMAQHVACDIHPLNNLRVLNYLRDRLNHDADEVNVWYRHWIAEGFGGIEESARRYTGDGRFLYGSSVTMADVCLVPQVYNALRFECDLTLYPTLRQICAHLDGLPAFAAARPEVQPDANT